jgi:predicted RNA-binding Zn ribbon-like protein
MEKSKFYFIANDTLLDLVNTEITSRTGEPLDLLTSFSDYLGWLVEASLIPPSKRNEVVTLWRDERENAQILDKVRSFRRNLRSMVIDLVEGRQLSSPHLDEINYFLAFNAGGDQIARGKSGLERTREYGFKAPVHFMAPLADAALRLLTERDLRYVRTCENPACTLLFYDTSKSRRRRWCSMRICGNRAKAAQFYRRHKR